MPGQKLTPDIPNAWAHTSIPTFIRESSPFAPGIKVRVRASYSYLIIAIFVENNNQTFTDDSATAVVDAYSR